jgi:uncharacterized coiled-coil protein SlyX
MSNNKLIALEEKVAHLQYQLDELNMVVFRQSETIDKLRKRMQELNENITNSKEAQSDQDIISNDRPPHY